MYVGALLSVTAGFSSSRLKTMDSIDKLLAQIKAQEQPTAPNKQPQAESPIVPTLSIDNLLAQVEADCQTSLAEPIARIPQQLAPQSSGIDNLLSQVKADVQEQDKLEAWQKQQQIQAQQLQQQQQRQKQLEALKIQAQAWLEKLDPLSSEGLWFDRFAQGYPTKLAAAIEYLQESHQ